MLHSWQKAVFFCLCHPGLIDIQDVISISVKQLFEEFEFEKVTSMHCTLFEDLLYCACMCSSDWQKD